MLPGVDLLWVTRHMSFHFPNGNGPFLPNYKSSNSLFFSWKQRLNTIIIIIITIIIVLPVCIYLPVDT